jgi:alpha-tubulin suppressor-like RCC1 family protein
MDARIRIWIAVAAACLLRCHDVRDALTSQPRPDADADSGTAAEPSFSLAAAETHACAVVRGALQCWGDNSYGQLGTGDRQPHLTPVRVGSASDWVQVVAATRSSCARRAGGSVWCWGANDSGQLGVDDFAERLEPSFVSLPASATFISADHASACAVLRTGALYCWGDNDEGQLGQGDVFPGADAPRPMLVQGGGSWLMADNGQGHTCGIRADATMWCWGRNVVGECGFGPGAPMQVRIPREVPGSNWQSVSTGQSHTCALKGDGSAHCTGTGEFGQLGLGDRSSFLEFQRIGSDNDWSVLSTNTFASCGIRGPASLFCWGRNAEGQLGTGDLDDRLLPELVSSEDWSQVSAGRFFHCAARQDLSIACSGENELGQLGTGDVDRRDRFTNVLLVP